MREPRFGPGSAAHVKVDGGEWNKELMEPVALE